MPRVISPPDGPVIACPECDRAGQIVYRERKYKVTIGDPEDDFACHECKESFDAPVVRPRKKPGGVSNRSVPEDLIERVRASTGVTA